MLFAHQIVLSSSVWENFIRGLVHIDNANQQRIDTFLASITRDTKICRQGESTVVSSCDLDEDVVVATLTKKSE